MIPSFLISVSLSESDRRALIIVAVILLILFLLLGLIGMLIRYIVGKQSEVGESMMYDVVLTNVVTSPKQFRKLAYKKNGRLLFKQTWKPVLVGILAVLCWLISSGVRNDWTADVFGEFSELFFRWDFQAEGVTTKVFGMTVLADWPPLVEGYPRFEIGHLGSYITAVLAIIAIAWYLLSCQGYLARLVMIEVRVRSVFHKSLKDFQAGKLDPELFKPGQKYPDKEEKK